MTEQHPGMFRPLEGPLNTPWEGRPTIYENDTNKQKKQSLTQ